MAQEQFSLSSNSQLELTDKAKQIFFFDDNDLPFNRDGKLSDKQKQRFEMTTLAGTSMFIFSGLVLSALLVWTWEKPINQFPIIISVLGMVSFTIIGIYVYRLGSKLYKSGVVKCVTGTITFTKWQGESFLQIGDEYFRSNRKFKEIFIPDILYKVYYAPSDNTIVSIEIVD